MQFKLAELTINIQVVRCFYHFNLPLFHLHVTKQNNNNPYKMYMNKVNNVSFGYVIKILPLNMMKFKVILSSIWLGSTSRWAFIGTYMSQCQNSSNLERSKRKNTN